MKQLKIKMEFNPYVAKDVGTNCAILLFNIDFWCEKNKANNKNFYDGHYWICSSSKGFAELFFYLTQKQIEKCLKKLEDNGYILSGNYNQNPYDRTKWYTVTNKRDTK